MALFLGIEPETLENVKGIFLNSYALLQGAYYLSQDFPLVGTPNYTTDVKTWCDGLNVYYMDCFKKYDVPVNFKDQLMSERSKHPVPRFPPDQTLFFLNTIAAVYSKDQEEIVSVSPASLVMRLHEGAASAVHDLAASRFMMLMYNEKTTASRARGPFAALLSARKYPLEVVLRQISENLK